MAYPQSVPSAYVSNGQTQWRWKTQLESMGDCYEVDSSAHAIVMGPDSDVARLKVTYYDMNVPPPALASTPAQTGAQSFFVTPDRPYIGRIDSRLDQAYPLANGKSGRLIVTVDDIFDGSPFVAPGFGGWVPAGFGATDKYAAVAPKLDFIAYFEPPQSLISQRSDARWQFNYHQVGGVAAGTAGIGIPFWGRKYAYVDIQNRQAAAPSTVGIRGITFNQTGNAPPTASEKAILAPGALAANARTDKVIRASVDGMFDMLVITITKDAAIGTQMFGPVPVRVITSDDPL